MSMVVVGVHVDRKSGGNVVGIAVGVTISLLLVIALVFLGVIYYRWARVVCSWKNHLFWDKFLIFLRSFVNTSLAINFKEKDL